MNNRLAVHAGLLAGIVILGLVVLSGEVLLVATPLLVYFLFSLLNSARPTLAAERHLSATRVGPDTPVLVRLTISNGGGAIRGLHISDVVPPGLEVTRGSSTGCFSVEQGETVSLEYEVQGTRGAFEFDRTVFECSSDFPLFTTRLHTSNPQELISLPDHRALSGIPISPRRTLVYSGTQPARRGGDGTEFWDVQLHGGRGEPRRINWRVSARQPGKIYVNEFQQERVADIGLILDARLRAYPPAHGRDLFERAATAAASLADVFLDQGNRVGFLAYGLSIDWTTIGFGRLQKHRILNRIATIRPGDSYVFFQLGEIPERLLPAGSQLVLVSPLTNDDAQAVIRLSVLRYAVLVVSPNPLPNEEPTMDEVTCAALRIARAERHVVVTQLRHAGIPVVDWDTRESFDSAIANAMGQIQFMWRRRTR